MDKEKTYAISIPFTKAGYEFVKKHICDSHADIDDEIKQEFIRYEMIRDCKRKKLQEELISFEATQIFCRPDYIGCLEKLKELGFIEPIFERNTTLSSKEFYKRLKKFMKKESIVFTDKYETTISGLKKIDYFLNINKNIFLDESFFWLIKGYIIGRFILKPPIKSNETFVKSQIQKKNTLNLDELMISLAKDYTETTMKFLDEEELRFIREVIISELIVNKSAVYKLRDIILLKFPDDQYLLNIDWDSVIRNELSFISNKAFLAQKQSGDFIHIYSLPGSCDNCKSYSNEIFNKSNVPTLPHKDCTNEICRCLYLDFNPNYNFLENGTQHLKYENEKEWQRWYEDNLEYFL